MRVFLSLVVSLAACCSQATASNFYTSIYGGLNVDSIIEAPFVKSDEGMIVGGAFGAKVAGVPGLRVEADLSYRTNDAEIFGGVLIVKHNTTAVMGNAVFDFGSGPVRPYILAGGGWAHTEAVFEPIALLSLEASGLAYQAGAGVNLEVASGVRVGVGYRYFQAPPITIFGTELSNGENQSAIASLSFDL